MTDPIAVATEQGERLLVEFHRAEQLTAGWRHDELALGLIDSALSRCLAALAQTGCWGRDNQSASHRLWDIAGDVLERGSLQWQARSKPRGYAGDFELLTRIWQFEECDDPVGRLFDRFFQRQSAAHVVRARIEQMAAALAEHRCLSAPRAYHVANVGSGPAIDMALALAALPPALRNVRATLIDLDGEAIEAAAARLTPLIGAERIGRVRENLFRLTQPGRWRLDEPADFIICTGLMDYLADEQAAPLIGMLYGMLAPGGRLVVGNFAEPCASRAYMEWIGNWYLRYRTPQEMRQLARRAGVPDGAARIGAERFACDLFLIADRQLPIV